MFLVALKTSVFLAFNKSFQFCPRCCQSRKFITSVSGGRRPVQNQSFVPTSSSFVGRIMKLFTDKGNPFTLKVLSASNLSNAEMEIRIVDKQGEYLILLKNKKIIK